MSVVEEEEDYFVELLRLDQKGDLVGFPGFRLAQVNRVKMYPGTIKAWHLHLKQDEIWCVTPHSHLLVGLWDVRSDSPTKGKVMRLVLGEGKTQLLYIPSGVAHGSSIVSSKKVEMLYFVNKTFNIKDPDELRLPWDSLGKDFWMPVRD
jgi:dTDP-4-dehydrorhamnose 3,5-epimerase